MYRAWLKHPNDTHAPFGHGFQALRLAALNVTRGTENFPPALDTALEELELALDINQGQDLEVEHATTVEAGTIIVGLCGSPAVHALTTHSGTDPCAQITSEEGFALHTLPGMKPRQHRSLLIASGGASGALYGAFEVVRRLRRHRLTSHVSGHPLHFVSNPSTAVRCINLWSQWRGFPFDAWMGWPAGREDSIFSWSDFLPGGNATRAQLHPSTSLRGYQRPSAPGCQLG